MFFTLAATPGGTVVKIFLTEIYSRHTPNKSRFNAFIESEPWLCGSCF